MGGKPVFFQDSRVINMESGFDKKLLCDGPTFTAGTACVYSCAFCYVPAIMRKLMKDKFDQQHSEIVVRRSRAVEVMRGQLLNAKGQPKFLDPNDRRIIFASPLVDVAANMELVKETIELCKLILTHTHWQIRLLSKSNLLPKIAQALDEWDSSWMDVRMRAGAKPFEAKKRIIYGVSTGTLDDGIAKAFEIGCPLVSKRIESLHWLQDNGFRTFGMICPSLPQTNPAKFARDMYQAIRGAKCEHVWAEVINVRGESFSNTHDALFCAGYKAEAEALLKVSSDRNDWECYARETFLAHAELYAPGQLRFLQYVSDKNRDWWTTQQARGAVLL